MESVQECIPNVGQVTPNYINPIPTSCCHVTLIYGLIPPMASRNRVNSSNMKPLQIQKVIPAGGFLGACSVTSMMVQTTSNKNPTAKQVIKLHFW